MGRYYDGDISGKFWFGVQSSDDGEYFGAEQVESDYINYMIDNDKIQDVKDGVQDCIESLGIWKERLDQFFEDTNGYNNDTAKEYWDKKGWPFTANHFKKNLEIYARLSMGNKIKDFFIDNPDRDCHFQAEF